MFQIKILEDHKGNEPIVLRIAFVIGNLAMEPEEYREALTTNQKLVPLLTELILEHLNGSSECLGKLVRAIGNLSLLPTAGRVCAASQTLVKALALMLRNPTSSEHDDIALVAIATLTNFAIYMEIKQYQVWIITLIKPLSCLSNHSWLWILHVLQQYQVRYSKLSGLEALFDIQVKHQSNALWLRCTDFSHCKYTTPVAVLGTEFLQLLDTDSSAAHCLDSC